MTLSLVDIELHEKNSSGSYRISRLLPWKEFTSVTARMLLLYNSAVHTRQSIGVNISLSKHMFN